MMKKLLLLALLTMLGVKTYAGIHNEPDSVKLFAYTVLEDEGRKGLMLAWTPNDGQTWLPVADSYVFLTSDYGKWGTQKRMFNPVLTRDTDGTWHCVWELTPEGDALAHAQSKDMHVWEPQQFFYASTGRYPYDKSARQTITLGNDTYQGTITKVAWKDVEDLIQYAEHRKFRAARNNERTEDDAVRFKDLAKVNATIKVDPNNVKPISEHLIGIFFEDINYGADGGLYAELVQNRDFEYSKTDGSDIEGWGPNYAWTLDDGNVVTISEENPIHQNNPHYAVIQQGSTLSNSGYDGIVINKGEKYDFSLYARIPEGSKGGKITVTIVDENGNEVAKGSVSASSSEWKKASTTITATADATTATLKLTPNISGNIHLDLISLFPQNTFNGRKNGLRKDLAQTLADLHPKFVRFPGGCVAHGDGIDNIYDWKGSVGELYERKPLRNIWNYHQTRGLGYHEFFLFCEDLGAEPLPVLAAGVPCQNSEAQCHHTTGELTKGGQQMGVPMEEMDQYVQDILDLVEYANGDAKKTEWGKKRAAAGHPAPFNLKYIGIGNEDLISEIFKPRFKMIYDAIQAKYPELTVVGTVGPFYEGSDYEEGWAFATELEVPMVDEHYYNTPGWFINNQDFYDRYDRNKSKVYLGEYAAHLPHRQNNIETALAEAIYLTSVERNADVVQMTSYAPLIAKENHTQWTPDLIFFNNTEIKPTVGYYTQLLFGQNSGTEYIASTITLDNDRTEVINRVGMSVVRDGNTGDIIMKLVNLLPIDVTSDIDIPLLNNTVTADRTVLTGARDDTKAVPTTDTVEVSANFSYTIPAYSLTVLRFKSEM